MEFLGSIGPDDNFRNEGALHLRLRVHREVVVTEDIDFLADGVSNKVACAIYGRPPCRDCSFPGGSELTSSMGKSNNALTECDRDRSILGKQR